MMFIKKAMQMTIVMIFTFYHAALYHATANADNDGFIPNFGAIPVMKNMQLQHDTKVDFDIAQGRIIEIVAISDDNIASIIKYYQTSLLQLGWQQQNNNTTTA